MNIKKRIDLLLEGEQSRWCARLYGELDYLNEVLTFNDARKDKLLHTLEVLEITKHEAGVLTKEDVLSAEEALKEYIPLCKQYTLHMVSHAHIDMNWRWGYDETVGIVLDTFRTMLKLLNKYPQFIFTQSQASVYRIVEKYAPEMLEEIRQYIKSGRWEVVASTWVEPDKNMPSGESLVRQILYTKQYLSKLLDLDVDYLNIDFEPDTFGHSAHLPEIVASGGVKYYYHCRGNDSEELYRWQAMTGAEILVLKDPQWYLTRKTDYHLAYHVPSFCVNNKTSVALRCYGVGDHGGGPTQRDIELITEMQSFPLMPRIEFSTLHAFFEAANQTREDLPLVTGEQNFIFAGCYTTQGRIKQANRFCEDRLYDTEVLCALAGLSEAKFHDAWTITLFNQFHDILPGSGVRTTREFALGGAQQVNARCVANSKRALHLLGEMVTTDAYHASDDAWSSALGGGDGYRCGLGEVSDSTISTHEFCVGSTGNEGGNVRVFTLFNTSQYHRCELVEIELWDWNEPLEATEIRTTDGILLPFSIVERDVVYWHHMMHRIAFMADVPPFGYTNIYVMPADRPHSRVPYRQGPRLIDFQDELIVLENECIRAEFRRETMELVRLISKKNGIQYVDAPAAYFELIDEQDTAPYSAWNIGQTGRRQNLNQSQFVRILDEKHDGLRQTITYEIEFRHSKLKVCLSLEKPDSFIRFGLEIDWQELGSQNSTPQLRFSLPYGYRYDKIRYDVPGGFVDRPELPHDVPAILYAAPLPLDNSMCMAMTSDCKYGYHAQNGMLWLTLVHSGYRPDPQPDVGQQRVRIGIGLFDDASPETLTRFGFCFSHPIIPYANTIHKGVIGENGSLFRYKGNPRIACLKCSEDGADLVLRVCNESLTAEPIILPKAKSYFMADCLERSLQELGCETIIPAGAMRTFIIKR